MNSITIEQSVCDLVFMYLSLIFTASFSRTFSLVLKVLQLWDDVMISYRMSSAASTNRLRRALIGCLIVMYPFLRDLTDRIRLENYLRRVISNNGQDVGWITNFIRGFFRPTSRCDSKYEGLLYLGIRLLLNAGADPNAVDENGDSALLLLSRNRSPWIKARCTSLLIKGNADLNQISCHGETLNLCDGQIIKTNVPKLTCLAALAVPGVRLRNNVEIINHQHVPKPIVKFVLQHQSLNQIIYFDKFYRNLSLWSSQVGRNRWKLTFFTWILTLILALTILIVTICLSVLSIRQFLS